MLWAVAVLTLLYAVQFGSGVLDDDSSAMWRNGLVLVTQSVLRPLVVRQRRRAREAERRNMQVLEGQR